jgi:hypothetical protein
MFDGMFGSSMVLINGVEIAKIILVFPMVQLLFYKFLIHFRSSEEGIVFFNKLLRSVGFGGR